MKVLVCGGRDYDNDLTVYRVLDELHETRPIVCLIHGNARGADSLAGKWATERGVQEIVCPANWNVHGKRAGAMRNAAMLLLNPDLVIAFPGGFGTKNMCDQARRHGLPVKKIQEW